MTQKWTGRSLATEGGGQTPTIDAVDADEFIRNNADPIWLHQHEMWEYMDQTGEDTPW